MPISLRARLVCPVDRPPISGGVVTIEGERIVAVEPAGSADGEIRDLGDVALLPGFVNAHTHLEFSHLPAPLGRPGMRLVDWLPLAIAERQKRDHRASESIALGLQESLLAGTCAMGEIATADATAYSGDCEVAVTHFLEVIGFSRARADSAFAALEGRLAERGSGEVPEAGVSPHAPYTVSPELLGKLVKLACAGKLPVAMHLAESAEELELLSAGSGPFRDLLDARSMWDPAAISVGSRPLDYLRQLADAPRALGDSRQLSGGRRARIPRRPRRSHDARLLPADACLFFASRATHWLHYLPPACTSRWGPIAGRRIPT